MTLWLPTVSDVVESTARPFWSTGLVPNVAFPSVNEAIRYADAATTERELQDLAAHIDQAREALEQAAAGGDGARLSVRADRRCT